MPHLDPVAISAPGLGAVQQSAAVEAARELEELGVTTLWGPGGQADPLPLDRALLAGTDRLVVINGIIPIGTVPAPEVGVAAAELEAAHPGRFLVGLGGAHSRRPRTQMANYLDQLGSVPQDRLILAALGPRMLELARGRAGGAYPYLVSTAYVRQAKGVLGPDRALAVLVLVAFEPDRARAREVMGPTLESFADSPAYRANVSRMGFEEGELSSVADRFLDALTIWGSDDRIVERVAAYQEAGADQVVLRVADRDGAALPRGEWRRLAELFFR